MSNLVPGIQGTLRHPTQVINALMETAGPKVKWETLFADRKAASERATLLQRCKFLVLSVTRHEATGDARVLHAVRTPTAATTCYGHTMERSAQPTEGGTASHKCTAVVWFQRLLSVASLPIKPSAETKFYRTPLCIVTFF